MNLAFAFSMHACAGIAHSATAFRPPAEPPQNPHAPHAQKAQSFSFSTAVHQGSHAGCVLSPGFPTRHVGSPEAAASSAAARSARPMRAAGEDRSVGLVRLF